MTIAVDFDGTIVEHAYPEIGKEKPFAVDTLIRLQEEGHRIILWSVREGDRLEEAVEFCRRRGLEFYAVNSDFPNASWSGSGVSRKVQADIYIDDRNLGGLPDWDEIYLAINEKRQLAASKRKKRKERIKKEKKKCWFKRLMERTREARHKYNG